MADVKKRKNTKGAESSAAPAKYAVKTSSKIVMVKPASNSAYEAAILPAPKPTPAKASEKLPAKQDAKPETMAEAKTETKKEDKAAAKKKTGEEKMAKSNASKPATSKASAAGANKNAKNAVSKMQAAPYKDMGARKAVLSTGFIFTMLGMATMIVGIVMLEMGVNVGANPATTQAAIYIAASVASFLGIIFAIAGANTSKSLARWAFFFGILTLLIGMALAAVMLFYKTFIPIEAFGRLGGKISSALPLV